MPWLSWIISNVALASALALAAWFVQQWLRRPALARMLWVLVLVKLVTPPLVSVPLVELPSAMACTLGVCHCEHHASTLSTVRGTILWGLLAVWSVGAGATLWTGWRRWTRFQLLISRARPAPPPWQSLAAHLSSELSIRRPPEILSVPGRLPPLVVPGLRQSQMLLPMELLSRLNDSQRESLLLHELLHIKRGDHLVRVLELTVSVAFWWLPVVALIGRHLRACEESCCDAEVVNHLPEARRDYARLLLDVIDFADPLPRQAVIHATAMSAANNLEQRLRRILDTTQRVPSRLPSAVLAVGLACAILPCQLHYDFVGRPATAAISDQCEPAAGPTRSPSGSSNVERYAAFCCPS